MPQKLATVRHELKPTMSLLMILKAKETFSVILRYALLFFSNLIPTIAGKKNNIPFAHINFHLLLEGGRKALY